MRVLALDLSSVTGWACGSANGGRISHGALKLPKTGENIGSFVAAFRDWLVAAIDEWSPGEIIYEMPILPDMTALMTVRKLNGLCAVTELVVTDLIKQGVEIGTTEANLTAIRMHFIGCKQAPKDIKVKEVRRLWLKQRTVDECRSRGFHVSGHDDADALALLSLRLSQLQKDFRLVQVEPPKTADEFVKRCAA